MQSTTLAFAADPIMRWFLPDAERFISYFPKVANAYGGRAIDEGTCFMTAGGEGAAMWLPPGVGPDEETMSSIIEEAVPEEIQEPLGQMLEAMDACHPEDENCWYLAIIGVDAGHQGKGLGATLMKHVTKMLDERGALGYLESSNPMNISLYQRHGFEIMDQLRFGNSPVMTPMIRQRQG
jgi:GNAT superfamily N-acetyltransferase